MKKNIRGKISLIILAAGFLVLANFVFADDTASTSPTISASSSQTTIDTTPILSPTSSPSESQTIPAIMPTPTPNKSRDNIAPSAITDLRIKHVGPRSADIEWTVPFDQPNNNEIVGYDLRVSVNPINESDWNELAQFNAGTPAQSGTTQLVSLSSLPSNTNLYAAVKSFDNFGNTSQISNVLNFKTAAEVNNLQQITNNNANNGSQQTFTQQNSGVVRMVIQKADGSLPEDLIFVNFINQDNGLSFGGAVNNGLVSVALPSGHYATKFLLPPNISAPDESPIFQIINGRDVDLGVVKLGINTSDLSASLETNSGLAKVLGFIIKLLFEILKQLKEISGKLNK